MPSSLLNLKVARERRGERPRNPEVEDAWAIYAEVFAQWANLCNSGLNTQANDYPAAQLARDNALVDLKQKRDDALMRYFEVYDKDQREAFG